MNFYDDLQDVIDNDPLEDMMIFAGNWNARLGPTDMATRYILGKVVLGMGCANAPPPQNLKLRKAYYASTKKKTLGQVEVSQRPLRSASAFDKVRLSPKFSSIKEATRFLLNLFKITQGFRLGPKSMCPTLSMPTTLRFTALAVFYA